MTGHSNRLAIPIQRIRDASLSARSSLLPPRLYSGFRLHSFSKRDPKCKGKIDGRRRWKWKTCKTCPKLVPKWERWYLRIIRNKTRAWTFSKCISEFCGAKALFHQHMENRYRIYCTSLETITWAPEEDELKVVFETPGVENILSNRRKSKSNR